MFDSNVDLSRMRPVDYPRLLTISLGTGAASLDSKKYSVKKANKWGIFSWLLNWGTTPLLDIFNQAGSDMVDFHISQIFQSLCSEHNYYLRIQVTSPNFITMFFSFLIMSFVNFFFWKMPRTIL